MSSLLPHRSQRGSTPPLLRRPSFPLLVGALSLAAWLRWPDSGAWLALVAVAAVWTAMARGHAPVRALAVILFTIALAAGFVTGGRLVSIERAWPEVRAGEVREGEEELLLRLAALVDRGRAAATSAVAEAALRSGSGEADLFDLIAGVRDRHEVPVAALVGEEGRFLAWSGDHRGPVPERLPPDSAWIGGPPLFRYLYLTSAPAADGTIAFVALLLDADFPPGISPGPDGAGAFDGLPSRVRILEPGSDLDDSILLRVDGVSLAAAQLLPPDPQVLRERILDRATRAVGAVVAVLWLLLAWLARREVGSLSFAAASAGLALLLPFGRLVGMEDLFGPAIFVTPGSGSPSLGRLAVVGLGLLVAGGAILRPRFRSTGLPWLVAVVGLGFPVAAFLLVEGGAVAMLAGEVPGWFVFQAALAVVLTLLVGGAFGLAGLGVRSDPSWRTDLAVIAAVIGLSAAGLAWSHTLREPPLWLLPLWIVPAWFVYARNSRPPWASPWFHAALIGVSAALVVAWGARIEASSVLAEDELERAARERDPYLEFLLTRFAAAADSLSRGGVGPEEILYRSWMESRLPEAGYPVALQRWSPEGELLNEIRVGAVGASESAARPAIEGALDRGAPIIRHMDLYDGSYLLAVALEGGAVATARVPPRYDLDQSALLEPLLGRRSAGPYALELVEIFPRLSAGGLVGGEDGGVEWRRTGTGWRAERTVTYGSGVYLAYVDLPLPGPLLATARGTLLLAGDLALLLAAFILGALAGRAGEWHPARAWSILGTYQGRIAAALFGFFVLSIAIFGTFAYRTLSESARRTATAIAERVIEGAGEWYEQAGGELSLLSRRLGAELIEYRDGLFVGGSVGELVRLGLYPGWIPPEIHLALAGPEAVQATEPAVLGEWRYVMGYRRMPDPEGDIVATPVSLRTGAQAVRRREAVDILAFAVLVGAGLSFGLALIVSRALARPIQTLRVASERVGRGNMQVRLPEGRKDEFAPVFGAFNRMVRRLRSARRDLMRQARRTRAIVEEAATGVIALDGEGRVTLVNPRAESLLGGEIERGRPIRDPAGAPEGRARDLLARWLEEFFESEVLELGTELLELDEEGEERRIRVRARRISRRAPMGGAVVILEDVTDELRAERVLAWGEMARQVAHEVKNPLTPIRLNVQHIQRAWTDRRPNFDSILERNVRAVLAEIDRLDSIARSFSRFGAPGSPGGALEPVDVRGVAEEIAALYRAGDTLRIDLDIPGDLPEVRAREAELKEVLVNLLENSREAVKEGGAIRIGARSDDDEVEIVVGDEGVGIPAGILPRIFEPHFSTRSKGAGLGLAIVRRLVESWGGVVTARSTEGVGTELRLSLSRWEA